MEMEEAQAHRSPATAHAIPGEVGIWAFVLGDMSVFSVLFCAYLYYRNANPLLYLASQALLDPAFGVVNTVVLLSSSWLVALAVHAVRRRAMARARRLLLCALGCGALFVGIKLLEYSRELAAGLTLTTDEFFSFYYVLTGLHLAHAVIGMLVLVFMIRLCRGMDGKAVVAIESGATYWHMVDVLWIVIFPLLYLVR